MASPIDDTIKSSYEVAIVQVAGLPRLRFQLGQSIYACVQVDAPDFKRKTKYTLWKGTGNLDWDDKFTLPPLPRSAKITFTLYRDSRVKINPSKSLVGRAEATVMELLEHPNRQRTEDIILRLSLKDKPPCELTVRITDASTTALASAMDQIAEAAGSLTAPRIADVAGTVRAVGSAITEFGQSDLVGSFTSLVEKMDLVVKIGDEIAKIHPWVSLAWGVLSVGLKLVKAQQDRDVKITSLIQTMQTTYSIVLGSEKLKEDKPLQDVLERILKQTVSCGFFIQDYTRRRSFSGKVIVEAFTSTDGLVVEYQDAFERLRAEFTGRIATSTALTTSDIAATVGAIRFDQVLSQLMPANMDETKRSTCLSGTRLDVIKSFMSWFTDDEDGRQNVMWLYGVAGAGKSTLSTTIACMMREVNLLGAFFFFNRDLPEISPSTLIRTIAYQLGRFDARLGAKIAQIVEATPNIAQLNLVVQFTKLLSAAALKEVEWSRGPILVVIDALDESGSAAERKDLIKVLSEGFSSLPSFLRILIISRPERDIMDRFKRTPVRCEELVVDLDTTQPDITTFIRHRLHEIREELIDYLAEALRDWPSDEDIRLLVLRSCGLFIWAATACLLIECQDPKAKMDELIQEQPSVGLDRSFSNLHQLYKKALQSSGRWDDELFCSDFRDILGVVLCAYLPLSCTAIDSLLATRRPSVQTVSRLGSVLHWSKTGPIRILHSSFYDYLTRRGLTEPWFIDVEQHNIQLACHCISLLEKELRENVCNLTLTDLVPGNPLSEPVSYASRFWIEHICMTKGASNGLGDRIYDFLQKHVLHWLEALAIIKAYDVTMVSLPKLLKWIQNYLPGSELYHFAYDALRFAEFFSATIEEHPLLIYVSALPFTPRGTAMYKTFARERMPYVIYGIQPKWPALLHGLYGHTEWVTSVVLSPDGSKVFSGSADKTIRVWDFETTKQTLPPLRGHERDVRSIAISPDGCKIISGSNDCTVRMWDAVTGQEVLPPIKGHRGVVSSVAFSPEGSKIASGSWDTTVRVWDAATGQEALPPLQGHKKFVTSVAFSPNGAMIISGSDDKTVRIWYIATGQQALPPLEGHEASVTCVAFSPDGSKIVSGSDDKAIRVWHAITGDEAFPPLQGHVKGVTSVAFSPDGSKIVSTAGSTSICIWDAATCRDALFSLQGHEDSIISAVFSPDGSKIISGGDETVWVWDAVTLTRRDTDPIQGHKDLVYSVAFSPDGSKIVSGSRDKSACVWNVSTGQCTLPPLLGHTSLVTSVAFSPDGSKVISGSSDDTIRVWDVTTGQEVFPPLQGQSKGLTSVIYSPDGSKIVSLWDETVRVWNAITGQEALPPLQGHTDDVTSIAFSPNGSKIVSGSEDATIWVWDAVSGQGTYLGSLLKPVTSVAFSPDGSKVLSGSENTIFQVWDISTGQGTLPLRMSQEDTLVSVAFSPDGSEILLGSEDGVVRVWDTFGNPLSSIGHTWDLRSMARLRQWIDFPPNLIQLDERRYFRDIRSGQCLSKIPVGFEFLSPSVYRSHCVGWRRISGMYIPIPIHFDL